jgi:aspartyl-tRNA(Asn)/glutamyl-tRNA(Gln) amidotransferase subunit A
MSGYRDAYYLRALKARTLLIEEFKKAFGKYDVLVHPTMPVTAPKFSEIEKLSPMQCYAMDLCTVPSNLCGLPHLSVNPLNLDGKTKPDALDEKEMPFGIMAIANHFNENKLLAFAEALK